MARTPVRPQRKGVGVGTRHGARGTRFAGRSPHADGRRQWCPEGPQDSRDAACRRARDFQDAVDRGRCRATRETAFAQLVHDHFLPRHDTPNHASTTLRNKTVHCRDGPGSRRARATGTRSPRLHELLLEFGDHLLDDVAPAVVGRWQNSPVDEACACTSSLDERSALWEALELARSTAGVRASTRVEAPAVAARAGGAIDPVSHSWRARPSRDAVQDARLGWRPTPHDLRRATWPKALHPWCWSG